MTDDPQPREGTSSEEEGPKKCVDENDEKMSEFFRRSTRGRSSARASGFEWKSGSDEHPSADGDDPMSRFFRRSSSRRSSNEGERIETEGYECNVGSDECPGNTGSEDGGGADDSAAINRFFRLSSRGRKSSRGQRTEWKPGSDEFPAADGDEANDPLSEFFQRSSLRRNSSDGIRLAQGYEWLAGDDRPPEDVVREDEDSSFTAELAYDQARFRRRTTIKHCSMNLAPNSAMLDQVLGATSAFTFLLLCLAMTFGLICLIPSMIFSKLMGWPSFINKSGTMADKNISTTELGSVTAVKALVARAQMHRQGSGGPDSLAPLLLDHTSVMGPNIPGSRLYSRIFLLMERLNFYLTGRLFQDQIARTMKDKVKFGVFAYLQLRTCWLDDCVETFVRRHTVTNSGKANANVVILGAGFDTRCYRMNLSERGVQLYEVDAPGTQSMKRCVLRDAGVDTASTSFVSCDFEKEDWLERLKSAGFDAELPTFFVWEGVTMYISKQAVKATIAKVALVGRGSMVGFDYLDRTWALSESLTKLTKHGREPWIFGMTGTEPEQLIEDCNMENMRAESRHQLTVLDHLKCEELTKRYLPMHYDGRPIGYVDNFGGFFLAGSTTI